MDLSLHHPILQAVGPDHYRMLRHLRCPTLVQRFLQALHRCRGRQAATAQGDDADVRPWGSCSHELPAAGAPCGDYPGSRA